MDIFVLPIFYLFFFCCVVVPLVAFASLRLTPKCHLATPQLPEGAVPPRAARLRVYPVAVSEGVVFVWMGDDPWGEGAKEILPVPSSADRLDENKVDNEQE